MEDLKPMMARLAAAANAHRDNAARHFAAGAMPGSRTLAAALPPAAASRDATVRGGLAPTGLRSRTPGLQSVGTFHGIGRPLAERVASGSSRYFSATERKSLRP